MYGRRRGGGEVYGAPSFGVEVDEIGRSPDTLHFSRFDCSRNVVGTRVAGGGAPNPTNVLWPVSPVVCRLCDSKRPNSTF